MGAESPHGSGCWGAWELECVFSTPLVGAVAEVHGASQANGEDLEASVRGKGPSGAHRGVRTTMQITNMARSEPLMAAWEAEDGAIEYWVGVGGGLRATAGSWGER